MIYWTSWNTVLMIVWRKSVWKRVTIFPRNNIDQMVWFEEEVFANSMDDFFAKRPVDYTKHDKSITRTICFNEESRFEKQESRFWTIYFNEDSRTRIKIWKIEFSAKPREVAKSIASGKNPMTMKMVRLSAEGARNHFIRIVSFLAMTTNLRKTNGKNF